MIVPSMNSGEIVKEVLLVFPKVQNKADFYSKILRRVAVKSKSKLAVKCWDYKSPHKNDWIILLKCTPSCSATITAVHYLNKMGFNCLSISNEGVLHHYSGHFLERYNERFLNQQNLSRLDIFKQYIHYNSLKSGEIFNPEEIEMKKVIFKTKDGLAFGTIEIIDGREVVDYRTFITHDMVKDYQQKDIDCVNKSFDEFWNEKQLLRRMTFL